MMPDQDGEQRTPRLPILLVGQLLLAGVLVVSGRWTTRDWTGAVDRVLTSPYSWLALVIFLGYTLSPDPHDAEPRRRWSTLRDALGGPLLALAGFYGVFGTALPDRWYGTLARIFLTVFSAVELASAAQAIIRWGQPASAMPIGPSRGPSSEAG